jgi:hypothetical protein
VRVSGSASTLAQLCLAGKAAGLGWPVVRTCLRGARVLNRREGLHSPQNAAASESFHDRRVAIDARVHALTATSGLNSRGRSCP